MAPSPLLGLLLLLLETVVHADRPVVTISDGQIRGFYDVSLGGRQYAAFHGIPYAAPPLGALRFKEPMPVKRWKGMWEASRLDVKCIQTDHTNGLEVLGEEDCLYVNVYSPQVQLKQNTATGMDVLVFFHPGAFMFGGGDWYGPRYIMDRDVVLVTVNYRLNVLGFLSTLDDVLPGNNGMKDQVAALKWVKKNIAVFGGNPNSVTITGTSAGGASVQYHYLSPLSEGLFVRGISTSGTVLCSWANAEGMREKAFRLGSYVGCNERTSEKLVNCLRDRPAGQLVEQTVQFQPWNYNPFSPFAPVIERKHSGAFITDDPLQALINGKLRDLPWMTGVVTSEGLYTAAEFIDKDELLQQLNVGFDEIAPLLLQYNYTIDQSDIPEVNQRIRNKYFGDRAISKATRDEVTEMMSDRLFLVAAARATMLQAGKNKSPVYFYQFDFRGTYSLSDKLSQTHENFGVCHADDVGYVLNTSYIPRFENQEERDISTLLIDMWISFMKTGNPNSPEHNYNWTPTGSTQDQIKYLLIESPTNYRMVTNPNLGNLNFWNQIPDKRAKFFYTPPS